MSDNRPVAPGPLFAAVVVVAFGFTLAAVVVVFIAVPEGGNPGSLAALIIAAFTALVPSLLGLAKMGQVVDRVERNGAQLDHLANGGGDAKIKAAVKAALDEHNGTTSS